MASSGAVSGPGDPERSLALADEAFERFEIDAVVAHLSAAVRGFSEAGDARRAAMTCLRLGDTLAHAMGNLTAGRAWFARAERLVADLDPCVEQGWVAVAAMGCDVGDPDLLLARAELALDRARRFGDLDLETKALADGGLAHVQVGRLDEGFAMLDEAMALACGPAQVDAAAKSACSFFTACYYSSEFDRAGSWADLLRQHGLIGAAPGGPVFLGNHCASLQGALLCELGRWAEAEEVLVAATEQFESTMGVPAFHSPIVLADLRIRQGRLDEAEAILLPRAQAFEAHLPTARLHLAREEHDLAATCAGRGLRALGGDRLRAVELLEVLVDAELGRGDRDAAASALDELTRRAEGLEGVPSVVARVAGATAKVRAATGDVAGAVAAVQEALVTMDPQRVPWRRSQLTALLDRFERTDRRSPSSAAMLCRTGRTWTASHDRTAVQLRDSKGLRYLAELVATPGREHHALDLVDRVEGVDAEGAIDRRRLGDAGPAVDAAARSAYRRRIEELRADLDDAVEADRLDEAEALQGELDALVQELSRAFGIDGRARTMGGAAERARLNVTRSLRTAITRLTESLPEAGAALDRSVRTGTYCTYAPADDDIRWIVQSEVNGSSRR